MSNCRLLVTVLTVKILLPSALSHRCRAQIRQLGLRGCICLMRLGVCNQNRFSERDQSSTGAEFMQKHTRNTHEKTTNQAPEL